MANGDSEAGPRVHLLTGDGWEREFRESSGRHEIWVTGADKRCYLAYLRIDPELQVISGDLMAVEVREDSLNEVPAAHRANFPQNTKDWRSKLRNANKDSSIQPWTETWRYSWQSEAVFEDLDHPGQFNALCDIIVAPSQTDLVKKKPTDTDSKIKLTFNIDRDRLYKSFYRRLTSLEIQVIRADGTAVSEAERLEMANDDYRHKSRFREITLSLKSDFDLTGEGADADGELNGEEANEVKLNALASALIRATFGAPRAGRGPEVAATDTYKYGRFKDPVGKALYESGLYLGESTYLKDGNVTTEKQNLVGAMAIANLGQYSNKHWDFTVMFSKAFNEDDKPGDPNSYHADIPYGRTLGLNNGVRKHRNRFGAIVFIREIIRKYCDHHKEDGQDWKDLATEIVGKTNAQREKHKHWNGLVHRVLFTVIHEIGHMLNLPHSWQRDRFTRMGMQANSADRTWMAYGSRYPMGVASLLNYQSKSELIEKSVQNLNRDLRNPQFTDMEKAHIRHAPFSEIAIGQNTFVDDLRPKPTLKDANGAQHKSIVLKLDQGGQTFKFHDESNKEFQPLTGHVLIPSDYVIEEDNTEGFHFATGMLKLIVQGGTGLGAKTIHYEAPLPSYDTRIWNAVGGLPAQQTLDGSYFARLPVLQPRFMDGVVGKHMIVQAMFLAPNGETLLSEQIKLDIKEAYLAPNEVNEILMFEDLSSIAEADFLFLRGGWPDPEYYPEVEAILQKIIGEGDDRIGEILAKNEPLNVGKFGTPIDIDPYLWLRELRARTLLLHIFAGKAGNPQKSIQKLVETLNGIRDEAEALRNIRVLAMQLSNRIIEGITEEKKKFTHETLEYINSAIQWAQDAGLRNAMMRENAKDWDLRVKEFNEASADQDIE